MKEWKTYKLGELINIQSGGTPNKAVTAYWGGNIPWISAKTMYVDFITDSDIHITEEGLKNGSKLAPVGSVLLLTRGSGLFNRIPVCLVKEAVAYNQDIKCITVKDNSITSNTFIFFWLYSQKELLSGILETTGIGAGKIDSSRLLEINVTLPDIETQNKFILLCSSIFEKIEINKQINDNLEQQAQALYKSWFVDFEPFKNGDFVESELGLIPIGWKVTELSAVTKQITGKVKDRTDVKVLSPVNSGELVLSEEYFTKQVFSESISKYIVVKPLHFAYNPARINIGSIGMNTFAFDGCVSPVYVVFECEKEYHHFFDYYRKTDSFKDEVLTRAIGGVRQTLSYKDFSLIKLVYPPLDVVREFNAIYERLLDNTNRTKSENSKLSDLRDTLLPKLMSGELKINEIDC